jgi:hypothetical protein
MKLQHFTSAKAAQFQGQDLKASREDRNRRKRICLTEMLGSEQPAAVHRSRRSHSLSLVVNRIATVNTLRPEKIGPATRCTAAIGRLLVGVRSSSHRMLAVIAVLRRLRFPPAGAEYGQRGEAAFGVRTSVTQ